jgi:spore coat polysaccharide biosynthesis protein SpsF
MNRRLVAVIACRNQGSRLYGKPLQPLDVERGIRVLDNIIACLRTIDVIAEIVLGISEGVDNEVYRSVAEEKGVRYVVGDQVDVLSRLVRGGQLAGATDVFRVTSESPFLYFEEVPALWQRHVSEGASATFMDNAVDGCGFEIITQAALEASHQRGERRHRSELCTLFIREHVDEFKVIRASAPPELCRRDLRLTVDNPEDLVVCRAVYKAFRAEAPRVPVREVVRFLDANPGLIALTAPFTEAGYATMYVWGGGGKAQQRSAPGASA